jgi:hypothetical protein
MEKACEDVKDGLPTIIAEPANIQIVETDVVKPRKPSLVHLNTPDCLDLTKTQRRWVGVVFLRRYNKY